MKILFCNKYCFPFSGTEVYLFELMDLLRSRGHDVALFSMADPRGKSTPYDVHHVPYLNFKDPGQGLAKRARLAAHAIYSTDARRRLQRMIADFQPDVAHVRNIYHHLSPSILWELHEQKVPVLYHLNDFKVLCPTYNLVSHGRACEQPCTGKYWKVLTTGCYSGSRAASAVLAAEAYVHHWLRTYRTCIDHFLTPSGFAKRLLTENGFDGNNITVLPHFQDLPEKVPPPSDGAPILYFGRLSPEKGVGDLIRAMKAVPHITLRIAGDGPLRDELEALTRRLELKNVEFLGHLRGKSLEAQIAAAQFTVLPSRAYETLGKSILESYAWGRPVVASDLGSRRELVRDGETGLLFPAGDIEQLSGAISYLVQRPELAAKMGTAGRGLVRDRHSPELHLRGLLRLYEQMSSTKKASSLRPQLSRPRLKVAFIGGRGVISKYSGIEAYYEEVGKQLCANGYDITVYCRNYFTPALESHNGMRVIRIPTIRSKHLDTVVHTALSTLHVMLTANDVVHYHAQGPALFSFLPRFVGKKTIVTVQGLDWQRKKWGRLASCILQMGELAALHLPNATMVVSRTLQRDHSARHGARTLYVPNGAVLRERKIPSKILDWGLTPDNYVLFLGRLSPEKNCHLLLKAFQTLSSPAKLVFAGGSSHTDSYAADLRKQQSERVLFLDWVSGEALDELLTNAAVFVLPSDLEGLSLALLDAMGAGVCVLTSDIPENREVVDDVGFTFRAGDVGDLARMLELLLSDAELRLVAGRSAKQRVQERYLWPNIAAQIGQIYDRVAGRTSSVERIPPSEARPKRETREPEHVA